MRSPIGTMAKGRPPPRSRARASIAVATLAEVRPALIVHGNRDTWREEVAELDALVDGHRVAQRSGHREPDAAKVKDGDVDIDPVGDLADAVVEDRVARDPNGAVRELLGGQREPDDVADDRPGERRTVTARCGRHVNGRSPGASRRVASQLRKPTWHSRRAVLAPAAVVTTICTDAGARDRGRRGCRRGGHASGARRRSGRGPRARTPGR